MSKRKRKTENVQIETYGDFRTILKIPFKRTRVEEGAEREREKENVGKTLKQNVEKVIALPVTKLAARNSITINSNVIRFRNSNVIRDNVIRDSNREKGVVKLELMIKSRTMRRKPEIRFREKQELVNRVIDAIEATEGVNAPPYADL